MKKLLIALIILLSTSVALAGPPAIPPSSTATGVNTTYDANSDGVIDADKVATLNQNTSGNAATATDLADYANLYDSAPTNGHIVGYNSATKKLYGLGAKVTDNSTASNVLAKDSDGHVENLTIVGAALTGTTSPILTVNSMTITKETGDGTYKGVILQYPAGETLAFGQPVYVKSDGKVWKADADGAATMPCIGIIVVGGNADATVSILIYGSVTETDWNWTVGGLIYVADGDAGALTQTLADISDANDVVQVVGIALHADSIFVNPSLAVAVLAAP